MNHPRTRISLGLAVTCLLGMAASATPAVAADRFTLHRHIPEDVVFVTVATHNPEQKFLEENWDRVMDAFFKSGALEDITNLMFQGAEQGDREQFERFTALMNKIPLDKLAKSQTALALRVPQHDKYPIPELVIILQNDAETSKQTYDALRAMLDELTKQIDDDEFKSRLTTTTRSGATITRFGSKSGDQPQYGISLSVRDDMLLLALGDTLCNDVIGMVSGEIKGKSIADSARFKKAFEGLPPAEDAIAYADFALMIDRLDAICRVIEKSEQEAVEPMRVMKALLADMRIVDYWASVTHTEDMSVHTLSRAKYTADASSRGLYKIINTDEKIDAFDKYVPAEAVSFSVSSGVNWSEAYSWGRNLIQKNVAEGPAVVANFDGMLGSIGLDLDRDVFSWMGGEMISIEMASSNPMMGADVVMMMRVKDDKKARDKISGAIEHLDTLISGAMGNGMGGFGAPRGNNVALGMQPKRGGGGGGAPQLIVSTPIEIDGKSGFYAIRFQHPMLMMIGAGGFQPVWGVHDNHLFMASSKSAIETCLKTADGRHDSIKKSERFRKEAVLPGSSGKLVNISFTDETKMAENIGGALAGVGMGLGMMMMAPEMQNSEAGAALSTVASIAVKLGPVAQTMDFFQSSATCTMIEGDVYFTHTVQNYRKSPGAGKKGDDWGDDWGD